MTLALLTAGCVLPEPERAPAASTAPPLDCRADAPVSPQRLRAVVWCGGGADDRARFNGTIALAAQLAPHAGSEAFAIEGRTSQPGQQWINVRYLLAGQSSDGQVIWAGSVLSPEALQVERQRALYERCQRLSVDPSADEATRSNCMQWLLAAERLAQANQQHADEMQRRDAERAQRENFERARQEQARRAAIADALREYADRQRPPPAPPPMEIRAPARTTTQCHSNLSGGIDCESTTH